MQPQRSSVEVTADLRCELDGTAFSFRSNGRNFVLDVPNLATLLNIFRLGSPNHSYRRSLHCMKTLLDLIASSLEIRIDGRQIGRMGYQVGNGWWRLFGFPPLTLKPVAILARPPRRI